MLMTDTLQFALLFLIFLYTVFKFVIKLETKVSLKIAVYCTTEIYGIYFFDII